LIHVTTFNVGALLRDRVGGFLLLGSDQNSVIDIACGEKLFGMRAAVFVGLHKRDLRWQLAVSEYFCQRFSVKLSILQRKLDVYFVRLAALIAVNVNFVNRH
jgi:hypothetical protein